MESKISYLLKENGQTRTTNWGVVIADGLVIAYPPASFIDEVKRLKRENYEIVYNQVPIEDALMGYDKSKYRELTPQEKERLEQLLEIN